MELNESSLTPMELSEDPELAALRILKTSLEVAKMALAATYPDGSEPPYSEGCWSKPEAYAFSILVQIDALRAVLEEYAESIRRLRAWRRRESAAEDIAF